MRFLAFDVETANNKNMGSICAVGWVLIQNNAPIDQGYSLINPRIQFSPYNVKVHGITESDVQNAPTFRQYWESTLCKLFQSSVVIAYNAGFDIAATEQALKNSGLTDFGFDYIDFLPICKFCLPGLPHYTLSCMAEVARVDFVHHNALDDALAIVGVAEYLCAQKGFSGIDELILRSHAHSLNSLSNTYIPKEAQYHQPVFPKHVPEHCITPVEKRDNALSGFCFCITGDVQDMSREDVERAILEHGGEFKTGVSRKTTFLIVGTYSDYPDGYLSSKHRKALDLISHGLPLQIISGDEFLSMLRSPESHPRILAIRERHQSEECPCMAKSSDAPNREPESSAPHTQRRRSSPGVIQLTRDGHMIEAFPNAVSASEATGINVKCIRDAAKGIQLSAGGYLWKFDIENDHCLNQED